MDSRGLIGSLRLGGLANRQPIHHNHYPGEILYGITVLPTGECKEALRNKDLVEMSCSDFPGERLMACRNPLLLASSAKKREKLLCATEDKQAFVVAVTKRQKSRLKGADKIGGRVGKVLSRFKVAKYFELEITDEEFSYSLADARLRSSEAYRIVVARRERLLSHGAGREYERNIAHIEAEAAVELIFLSRTHAIYHFLRQNPE